MNDNDNMNKQESERQPVKPTPTAKPTPPKVAPNGYQNPMWSPWGYSMQRQPTMHPTVPPTMPHPAPPMMRPMMRPMMQPSMQSIGNNMIRQPLYQPNQVDVSNQYQFIIQRLDALSSQINMNNMQQQQFNNIFLSNLNNLSKTKYSDSELTAKQLYDDAVKLRIDYDNVVNLYKVLNDKYTVAEKLIKTLVKENEDLKSKASKSYKRFVSDLDETIDEDSVNEQSDDDNEIVCDCGHTCYHTHDEEGNVIHEDNEIEDEPEIENDEEETYTKISQDDVEESEIVKPSKQEGDMNDVGSIVLVIKTLNDITGSLGESKNIRDSGTSPLTQDTINKMKQHMNEMRMKFGKGSKNSFSNTQTEKTVDNDYESEYDSEEEFEEIEGLNTLEDLIRVGKMYETLCKNTSDASESSGEFIEKGLSSIGMKKEDIKNILKNSNAKILKQVKSEKSKDKKSKNRRGCYTYNGVNYSINLEKLNKLVEPLEELQVMIGMEDVKKNIVSQVLYLLQNFETVRSDMLHTVLQGPPGVGKSDLGRILGKIYQVLGKSNGKFEIVRREDLIGEYIGHTEANIKRLLERVEGGVLFIDEAYALGNEGKNDSYSEAAINTIVGALDDPNRHFVCIVAGYPDELKAKFFGSNPGMERRFTFRYSIMSYEPEQLRDIFLKKVNDSKFKVSDKLDQDTLTKFFTENKDKFPNYGGDMKKLFLQCKISHSNRICGKHPKFRKKLTMGDINTAFDSYLKEENIKLETKAKVETKKQKEAIEKMMREYKHKREYRKMIHDDIVEETLDDMVINAECKLKLHQKQKNLLRETIVEDMLITKKSKQEVKKMLHDVIKQEVLDDMEFDMNCKNEFRQSIKNAIKNSNVEQMLFENECKRKYEKDLEEKDRKENKNNPSIHHLYT